ncbi:uncharacterized membrane protein YhaH (DUF805 family) [Pseudaminobacter salicylatoxidans]|uniref:Uncharacterized membrane protein YhaH (DUF805 family) n=1 Tax=Pseudaminobacter salicylatoxidans TaxID=93369 RepID=A0A316C4G9_PSESE|nr:DUF805 domain-containing protein [Pseudaminobacter salicylatoxidans]PWJ80889.1 uncharacterized membrane protein YhaH (DUF805 family) [Pseudaminobacter salicylatoxidans]
MADKNTLIWLFFRFSGRIGRAVYVLAFLLMLVVVSFPLYQHMRFAPGTTASDVWSTVFGLTFIVFLWVHVATSVKRLHDMGKSGLMAIALFIPVVSLVAFVVFCLFPGNEGRNQYGEKADSLP